MDVISEKKLREFWQTWPDAEQPLRAWHRTAERATREKFADVREVYRMGSSFVCQLERWAGSRSAATPLRLSGAAPASYRMD